MLAHLSAQSQSKTSWPPQKAPPQLEHVTWLGLGLRFLGFEVRGWGLGLGSGLRSGQHLSCSSNTRDHAACFALQADLAPADNARGGRRAVAHQVGAQLAEGAVDAVVADLLLASSSTNCCCCIVVVLCSSSSSSTTTSCFCLHLLAAAAEVDLVAVVAVLGRTAGARGAQGLVCP